MAELESQDRQRAAARFRLKDLDGREWALDGLRGKVVVLNSGQPGVPHAGKELPDLAALYGRFRQRGLVILAVTDEDPGIVKRFVAGQKIEFPVLLDLAAWPTRLPHPRHPGHAGL